MGILVDCKTKEGTYEKIKDELEGKGYTVRSSRAINYGIQFEVSKEGREGLIRIYSNKKGVTLDLSTTKDKRIVDDVLLVFGHANEWQEVSEVRQGNFHSLCVGINEFKSRFFQDLSYAKKDAERIHELISEKFGTDESHNICLTNAKATKAEIIAALRTIKENAKVEDTVVVFVASHGEAIKSNGLFEYYIVPSDVNDNAISDTAVAMKEVREIVSTVKADKKVIFLDTCYSGGISRRDRSDVSPHAVEALFDQWSSENFVMVSACQPDQTSLECHRLQQGVFTHFLLRGLTGNVENTKEGIDIYTLYLFLAKEVSNYAQIYYKKEQKPKFFGSVTGPLHLPILKIINPVPENKKFSFEKINCAGIDESGKGDYFGPLVVAAVYVDTEAKIDRLRELGIKDSKAVPDSRIRLLARRIKESCDSEVIAISPARYNQLSDTMLGLNEILAWSHAQSLEKVLQRNPSCDMAISDQFSGKEILLAKLKEKGKKIDLIQRTKAEENIAVAAASILARDRFLESLEIMERQFRQEFHKGANDKTIENAVEFVRKGGNLSEVAKIHFKTTRKVKELVKEAPAVQPSS